MNLRVGATPPPLLCSSYLLKCTATVTGSKSDSIPTEAPTHITTVPTVCLCRSVHGQVQTHCMTAPTKDLSSCSHMKGSSRSGTHDVGVIPAMYNSSTAGTQHVPPFSQVGRQASLGSWQQMLVMCNREQASAVGRGDGLLHMCI